jgi:hypothetical protein
MLQPVPDLLFARHSIFIQYIPQVSLSFESNDYYWEIEKAFTDGCEIYSTPEPHGAAQISHRKVEFLRTAPFAW